MSYPAFSVLHAAPLLRRCLPRSRRLCTTRAPHADLTRAPAPDAAPQPTTRDDRPLRRGDDIDVKITHIGYGGVCVGRLSDPSGIRHEDHNLSIYAPKGACPGDVVRCSVSKVRRRRNRPGNRPLTRPPDVGPDDPPPASFVEALYTKLLQPSAHAVEPPCPHFGNFRLGGNGCGGCSSLQMSYAMQLAEKTGQMSTLFTSLAEQHRVPISPIIACRDTLHYRNKMEFTFGRRWYTTGNRPRRSEHDHDKDKDKDKDKDDSHDDYALGLHAPQRFDKVVEITDCHIHHPIGNEILALIRARAPALLLEPYDARLNTGYLRNVAIRTAVSASGRTEVMVNLITSPCEVPQRLAPLAAELARLSPDIVCVVQNIRGVTGTHNTEFHLERLLFGERAYIEQSLCGLTFRISANSFFQTNPAQAAVLYETVRRAARLRTRDGDGDGDGDGDERDDKVVLDLFCGTGTIGLCLARDAAHVYGMDVIGSAIADARVNAATNGIENATFVEGNLDKLKGKSEGTEERWIGFAKPDVIIVDPPRAGLHPDLVRYLAGCAAKRIVYVSCNPVTQVQDVQQVMRRAGGRWRVTSIQPIDMFPNTHHVECVVALERSA